LRPPSATRVPTGNAGASEPQPATNAAARSSWNRTISIESTASSRPISSAINREHLRLRRLLRDQRRDPAQRRLLLRQHTHPVMGARIGDRGRRKLREVLQPRLGLRGNRAAPFDVTVITPHVRPSTEIGTPIAERMPIRRIVAAMTPVACS
jgi:hypothetical protein